MKRTMLLVPAALLAVGAIAASMLVAPPARADNRNFGLSGFDGVTASGGVDVVLKQGPFSVVADGTKKEMDRLLIEVHGQTLSVGHKSEITWFGHSEHMVVTVTAPSFKSIGASGGSDVDGSGLSSARLAVTASGGADIKLTGAMGDLDVTASGGADVKLSGECASLTARVSSGSDLHGKDLKCKTADITASGGADAEAWANGAVKAHASGGADIHLLGSPASLDKTTSGGGSVKVS